MRIRARVLPRPAAEIPAFGRGYAYIMQNYEIIRTHALLFPIICFVVPSGFPSPALSASTMASQKTARPFRRRLLRSGYKTDASVQVYAVYSAAKALLLFDICGRPAEVKLKNEAQPEVVVPVAGRVVVTIGGPAVAGVVVPAAATVHAVRASRSNPC